MRPIRSTWNVSGPAVPVRHDGSVDVLLAALDDLEPGSVLVIDDRGRTDRACIGDLVTLEAKSSGAAGLVVWGVHRDTFALRALDFPVFSLGCCPAGPNAAEVPDPGEHGDESVRIGTHRVLPTDLVVADADGVLLIDERSATAVIAEAHSIQATEREQVKLMNQGMTLRAQLDFERYRRLHETDPAYSLRHHLRARGGAVER
jgi:regulator of RNase E activity RraA